MATRLDNNIEAMAEQFPHYKYSEDLVANVRRGHWVGDVQPIIASAVPFDLIDDLYHDRAVYVTSRGVEHWSGCKIAHCVPPAHSVSLKAEDLAITFQLEVTYNGAAAIPRCRVLSSSVPLLKINHQWPDGAMCAFLASDWNWRTQTVANAMRDHYIWLVKWMVFNATDQWIGRQHENNPAYHLQVVDKKDPCWCGSGLQYRRCCRSRDFQQLQFLRQQHEDIFQQIRRQR